MPNAMIGTLPPLTVPWTLGKRVALMGEDISKGGVAESDLRRRVAAAVATLFPRLSLADREDVVQSTMVRLLEALARAPGGSLNATYVWRTAHSVVLDEMQRARRRFEVATAPEDLGDASPRAPSNPESDASLAQLRRAVRACFGTLAPERRRAVALHWFGYEPRETARLLGWTAKRAANLCYRGLADLRACVAAKGFAP